MAAWGASVSRCHVDRQGGLGGRRNVLAERVPTITDGFLLLVGGQGGLDRRQNELRDRYFVASGPRPSEKGYIGAVVPERSKGIPSQGKISSLQKCILGSSWLFLQCSASRLYAPITSVQMIVLEATVWRHNAKVSRLDVHIAFGPQLHHLCSLGGVAWVDLEPCLWQCERAVLREWGPSQVR